MAEFKKPHLALVIPVLNEAENIFPVFQEISGFRKKLPPFEILAVDDGSQDQSLLYLQQARQKFQLPMRIFHHPFSLGKSAALYTAISHSHADWIATMDADGQDNPAFIPKLLERAEYLSKKNILPLIVGVRRKRQDNISRRFATRAANFLRLHLLKDGCFDSAAPVKVFPKDFFLSLPQFEGMHRFLPAFLKMKKGQLEMVEICHRPRLFGHSKYKNSSRAFVGLFDLFGVCWFLQRYRDKSGFTEY